MHRIAAIAAAVLIVVACGALTVQGPAAPDQAEQQQTPDGEAPSPAQRSEQRGSDEWCARSLCGCWEPATLHYRAELRDAEGAPAADVEMFCHGEEAPIARSDVNGVLEFEIETERSPGCGYQRCRNMTLRDPQGRFADKAITAFMTGIIALEPAS
jgi:hypothetical protein